MDTNTINIALSVLAILGIIITVIISLFVKPMNSNKEVHDYSFPLFIYVDEVAINTIYETLNYDEREKISTEISTKISYKFPLGGGEINIESAKKTFKIMKPKTVYHKIDLYLSSLFIAGKLRVDLIDFLVATSTSEGNNSYKRLKSALTESGIVNNDFFSQIENEDLRDKVIKLFNESAKTTGSYFLINEKFFLVSTSSENIYVLSLEDQLQNMSKIKIEVLVLENQTKHVESLKHNIGNSLQLTVFGQARISYNANMTTIQITPLSIS